MHHRIAHPYALRACLVLAAFLLVFGCGDKEPEQRRAFASFLEETILSRPGVAVADLSREQKKAFGDYADHYVLLTGFQRAMSEYAKDAEHLLREPDDAVPAVSARRIAHLEKAAREALALHEKTIKLRAKTDKTKEKLPRPEGLAPVFDAAYAKVVARPADTFAAVARASHESLAASIALLDFIATHNHDVAVENGAYAIYNRAVEPEFMALRAVAREKARALETTHADFVRVMTQ